MPKAQRGQVLKVSGPDVVSLTHQSPVLGDNEVVTVRLPTHQNSKTLPLPAREHISENGVYRDETSCPGLGRPVVRLTDRQLLKRSLAIVDILEPQRYSFTKTTAGQQEQAIEHPSVCRYTVVSD